VVVLVLKVGGLHGAGINPKQRALNKHIYFDCRVRERVRVGYGASREIDSERGKLPSWAWGTGFQHYTLYWARCSIPLAQNVRFT